MDYQQWAQTAEAQPYLAKYGYGQAAQQGGGGMVGIGSFGNDSYSAMLKSLFDANAGNPTLQKSFLGAYLDYANPLNQQSYYQQQLSEQLAERQRQQEIADQFLTEAYNLRRQRSEGLLNQGEVRQPVNLSYQYLLSKARNWGLPYESQDIWGLLGNT